MTAYLKGVCGHLPDKVVTNDDLVRANPDWDSEKIFERTGIRSRRVASDHETASDLGFHAADKLLKSLNVDRGSIDALLFCTQTPDYLCPASACLLQTRLDLPTTCAAFDYNLGCSGFVYGLWLARALVDSQSSRNVLVVVGDTCSKLCNPHDMTTTVLFGDGGGAALISANSDGAIGTLGPSIVGTDGRGAENLIVPVGAARNPRTATSAEIRTDDKGNQRSDEQFFMNGVEVFNFSLKLVVPGVMQLLERCGLNTSDIDLFLFHQANAFMLERLRKKMNIPIEKMPVVLEHTGNTSCATIPLLMQHCQEKSLLKPGDKCVLAGFGVGYSWAFSLLQWGGSPS